MRPRSPAPPRRAGAAPGQGRAGWVGTGPASPPRLQFRPVRAPCTPAAPPWLLRCLLLRTLLPSARLLTSLASAQSFPRLPHLPLLLPSSPTFSPARPPLFLLSQGEGSDTLGPRYTPRGRYGPGRWGNGACGVLPRPRTAPGSGAAGADQVFVSYWRPLSTRALPQAAGTVTSESPKTGFCETSGEPFALTSKIKYSTPPALND